ncbi:MAG TPA: VTT domain-containing protein [Bacilli bacterium]|nr:VTT domain-containing protein [Bacilli bacterium]
MEVLQNLNEWVINTIQVMGPYWVFFSCFLIVIESIVPILPLGVFITINFLYYGTFIGFLISWAFTIAGCTLSFFLCQKAFKKFIDKKVRKNKKIDKWLNKVDDLKFSNLVILIAIPFTPAFLVNIAAGVSKMPFKKFFPAILIGKIFLVLFWGYIGVSLIEALKNPIQLLKIAGLVLIAYGISVLVNKKLKLD